MEKKLDMILQLLTSRQDDDRLIGQKEVLSTLSISPNTLKEYEKRGQLLPRYTINSHKKYWLSEVKALAKLEPVT